jgi:5'-3' exonuclease
MHAHKAVSLVPFMDMSALKLLFDDCVPHLEACFLSRNEFGRVLIFTAHGQSHCLLGITESPVPSFQPGVVVHTA